MRTLALVGILALGLPCVGWAQTAVQVLSNRADLISGGDALVEVEPPPPAGTVVDLDGADVSGDFALRANGRFLGLVTGLDVGPNVLTVTLPDASGASITIENHPPQGPIFTGPHLQPWDCTTEDEGFGPAADEHCNITPVVEYLYIATGGGGYQTYDLGNPPTDVANVTTDEGVTVRHIIRRESGAINRGLYAFAVLWDPDLPWEVGAPQAGWNGKLYYPFGASCNTNQTQGSSKTGLVSEQVFLAKGFAIATTSLNELGHHCNPILSAETVMMTKERVIETLGEIRYTIGTGASGGSIGQLQISNAYPGLLDGLIPSLTYPDVWSTAIEVGDCLLTELYWPKAAVPFTLDQRKSVDGHGSNGTTCASWVALFVPSGIPTTGCFSGSTLPTTSTHDFERDYDPVSNRDGCRATVNDIQANIWGHRPRDGFAKRPLDNEGVQYGLGALNRPLGDPGKITFAQFLDLNLKIGGADIDGVPTATRTRMDLETPGIAYRTGNVQDGRGLARVAMIDQPSMLNDEIHTPYHSYALEARLVANNGHADNQAIWRGLSALVPVSEPDFPAFDVMDAWLEAVEADASADPLPVKIVNNRPPEANDSCFIGGTTLANQVFDPVACDAEYPVFGDARLAAGMPARHDVLKCQRKPIDPADYAGADPPLTPADLLALDAAFPDGVCDYSLPSQEQTPTVPWLSYEDGPGGQPLGPAPTSTPF